MSNVIIAGRFVVCAACRYGDLIFAGARHFDLVMQSQIKYVREEKLFDFEVAGKAEQGFIDQFGIFMDREEAYEVALAAGQINNRTRKTGSEGSKTLFSEDLY